MSKKKNTVTTNRTKGAVIALVILLVIAAAGVGVLGYYSSGFSDWSRIEAFFAADSGTPGDTNAPDDGENPTPPAATASYADLSVGNLIPTLYFNTNFDVKGYFADIYPYGLPQNFGILFMSETIYQALGFMPEYGKSLVITPLKEVDANVSDALDIAIMYDGTVVYCSSECSVDGTEYPAGWQIDSIEVLQEFSFIEDTEDVAFKAIAAQIVATSGLEHLRYFISQDGVFYNEAANIVDDGIQQREMFTTVYFDTSFDVAEHLIGQLTAESLVYQPLMIVCGETSIGVLSLAQLTGSFEDINNIVIICDSAASGTLEREFIYCSEDFYYKSSGYKAGWQRGELEFDNGLIVDTVAGKNFLKYFVSFDGEFAALEEAE